jgi:hypothetical protein
MTVTYGPSPFGQLVYDLGFTKLGDRYLARKHHLPIQKIREYRAAFKRGWKQGKAQERRRRR